MFLDKKILGGSMMGVRSRGETYTGDGGAVCYIDRHHLRT